MGKPRNTRKYPTYPEIPEIPGNTWKKKNTRKYPIVFFDTPTRPEPDPLPGILSNTRPDPILKNPTRWALEETHFWFQGKNYFDRLGVFYCYSEHFPQSILIDWSSEHCGRKLTKIVVSWRCFPQHRGAKVHKSAVVSNHKSTAKVPSTPPSHHHNHAIANMVGQAEIKK